MPEIFDKSLPRPGGVAAKAWWIEANIEGKAVMFLFHFGGVPNYLAAIASEAGQGLPGGIDDAAALYKRCSTAGCRRTTRLEATQLAAVLLPRDEGVALPAAAWIISPWCDLTSTNASITDNVDGDPIISIDVLQIVGPLYLVDNDPKDLTSPRRAQTSRAGRRC